MTSSNGTAIQSYLDARWPEFLAQFEAMVRTNSHSFNSAGVNALGQMTAKSFEALGFQPTFIQAADGRLGQHLALRRGDATARIGLISHLDTVFSVEEEQRNNFAWRPEHERIYGPGTVDIKGGTIVALMTLAALQALYPDHFNRIAWRVLLNAGEEVLAPDFGSLVTSELAGGVAALVFETGPLSPTEGRVVVARKGRLEFSVQASGRSAHAGISHAKGVSAIHQLARAVPAIEAITDYARDRTCSIGLIQGGDSVNTVPAIAKLSGEIRAFDPAVLAEGATLLKAVEQLPRLKSAEGDYVCELRAELVTDTPAWPANPATEALLRYWQRAGESMGLRIEPQARGGLSDGNRLWQRVPTLDGLGPAGDNLHCSEHSADANKEQEYVLASSIVPKATLNCLSIVQLIEESLK